MSLHKVEGSVQFRMSRNESEFIFRALEAGDDEPLFEATMNRAMAHRVALMFLDAIADFDRERGSP